MTNDKAIEAAARVIRETVKIALTPASDFPGAHATLTGIEDAARAALLAAERAAWRPIETAPVDRTTVDVCYVKSGDTDGPDQAFQPRKGEWFATSGTGDSVNFLGYNPTHWAPRRPLPAPPDGGGA